MRSALQCSCLVVCGVFGSLGWSACTRSAGDVERAQGYYERHQYAQSLAILRRVDAERERLKPKDQLRYFYFRGMTDLRLGYLEEARYWLGLARAQELKTQLGLEPLEHQRLMKALEQLDLSAFEALRRSTLSTRRFEGEACQWSAECIDGQLCVEGRCGLPEHSHAQVLIGAGGSR